MSADVISVVEECYRTEVDDEAWLSGIARAALGSGNGYDSCLANFFDASNPEQPITWARVSLPGNFTWEQVVTTAATSMSPAAVRSMFDGRAISTMSEKLRAAGLPFEEIGRCLGRFGIADVLGVPTPALEPKGIVFSFGLARPRDASPAECRTLQRLAAHVGAGMRLRAQMASAAIEAVLRTDGRLEHATPEAQPFAAREALRAAARAIDRARSRARRRDGAAALDLWKALVAGRWSLVDSFESDGRRYLLARRNPPNAPARPPLTDREAQIAGYAALGHGNKLIAYELGLAVSTIAAHLASAQRKLGVDSRVALVRVVQALRSESH
jgi:DNA-binding CsgD family transcriptional regulator